MVRLGLAALLGLAACSSAKPVAPPQAPAPPRGQAAAGATLFVSSELLGYLGPCGCSEAMRGGVERTAFQIAQARSGPRPVFYVDAGNALFQARAIPAAAVGQQERKARALAEAFALMKLDALAPGPLDDAQGEGFRAGLKLPTLLPGAFRLLEGNGVRLAVVTGDDVPQLVRAAAGARAKGATFVVGLLAQPLERALKALREGAPGVDLAIATRASSELEGEENRLVAAAVPVLQLQSKGRSLLRVDLEPFGDGAFVLARGEADRERELAQLAERIALLKLQVNAPDLSAELKALKKAKLDEVALRRDALEKAQVALPPGRNAFTVRFVALESSLPALPAAKALVTAYDRDVGVLNLQWAKEHGEDCAPPPKGAAGYVGSSTCQECHLETFPVWEASKHSHAYQTLVALGKNHHLDCVGCHVVGWQQSGGVCRIDRTAEREHVGCESCHGPGSNHAAEPSTENIARRTPAAVCVGCHDRENSPAFEYERYLAQVLGPGHGKPVAAQGPR